MILIIKKKKILIIYEQSEKIRKDFSQNMFNNKEVEYNIRVLRQENDELKKAFNSFNEKHRCCYSYNY